MWFASAVDFSSKSPSAQVSTFLAAVGDIGAREFDRHVKTNVGDTATTETVLEEMTTVFKKEINHTQSRYELFNIKQKGRSLETYLEDIEKKADECD